MSLFDEDPKRWLELLYSLPPIDLEECFRKQQQAKKKLLDERDKPTCSDIVNSRSQVACVTVWQSMSCQCGSRRLRRCRAGTTLSETTLVSG